ncbi:hypothetical protein D3C79_1020280 [compost metagenome]
MWAPSPVGLGHPLLQARFAVIDDQQGQLEHLAQVCAFGRQGRIKIGQGLTGLLGEYG